MKVKVGDTVYDGSKEPVMVILTAEDKQNISRMAPDATKYVQWPDTKSDFDVRAWMADD